MDTNRYPANVFWSDEDEGFIAVAPDLEGCSAFGATAEEALAELQHAISAWIQSAESIGKAVPRPSNPAAEQEYSGKILLRMSKWLHRRLACSAEENGVSLNQHLVTLLTWNEATKQSHKVEKEHHTQDLKINYDFEKLIGAVAVVHHIPAPTKYIDAFTKIMFTSAPTLSRKWAVVYPTVTDNGTAYSGNVFTVTTRQ